MYYNNYIPTKIVLTSQKRKILQQTMWPNSQYNKIIGSINSERKLQ